MICKGFAIREARFVSMFSKLALELEVSRCGKVANDKFSGTPSIIRMIHWFLAWKSVERERNYSIMH